MSAISRDQIKAIHTLKKQAGLGEDEAYRDFLAREAGVGSSRELTATSAGRVIERLKGLAGQKDPSSALRAPSPSRGEGRKGVAGALELSGPYAPICRALWIDGYQLGVFQHREDTALTAFVERQTGLASLNWLRDHEPATKVIQALKDILTREAGVKWPGRRGTVEDSKLAVIAAQRRMLDIAPGPVAGPLDAEIARLGALVRAKKGAV